MTIMISDLMSLHCALVDRCALVVEVDSRVRVVYYLGTMTTRDTLVPKRKGAELLLRKRQPQAADHDARAVLSGRRQGPDAA